MFIQCHITARLLSHRDVLAECAQHACGLDRKSFRCRETNGSTGKPAQSWEGGFEWQALIGELCQPRSRGSWIYVPRRQHRSPSALTVGIQISFSQMSAGQKVTLALLWSSSHSLSTSPTSLDFFFKADSFSVSFSVQFMITLSFFLSRSLHISPQTIKDNLYLLETNAWGYLCHAHALVLRHTGEKA